MISYKKQEKKLKQMLDYSRSEHETDNCSECMFCSECKDKKRGDRYLHYVCSVWEPLCLLMVGMKHKCRKWTRR